MKQEKLKMRKKAIPYAKRKAAFDDVMAAYRDSQFAPMSAIQYGDNAGGTRYAARPTLTDFKCDVERVIKKCVTDELFFRTAYVLFTPEDVIEREVYADKIIGAGRHNLEQGMGAEFIRRHIYPTKGKGGYFNTVRRPHAE
jgi:hypothetical protein